MTLLLVYAVLATAVSFLCSLLEACLLSVPRSYVESMVERGSRAGPRLRELKNAIDRPLAAILTLNTIAHTVGAAGVGAQAAVVFGSGAVGIASAVMTLVILIASEIIPKTLGAVHAKRLAAFTTYTVHALIMLCLPLIIPLEWINSRMGHPRQGESISRAELLATIRLGQSSGVLREREHRVAMNLMALSTTRLREVMTPRTVVFSLPAETTVGQVIERHHPIRFGRIPVYEGAPDRIGGYVTRFAVHKSHRRGELDRPIRELSEPIPIMPETATAGDALDALIRERRHIALIVDEYGGMTGIITLEDLIETLLGDEIVDETDAAVDMQEFARRLRDRRKHSERGRETRG
jgi:CBS domain containing-hemolysin-like protein